MGFFGDLFSHPLNALKQVADFAAPVVSFLPGGAQAEGAFNLFNNAFNHGGGGQGGNGGGAMPYNANFGGGGGGFGGGINPGVLGLGLDYLTRNKYQDAGMGDKALGNGNAMTGAGNSMLSTAQSGLPSLDNMGALSGVRNVMNQRAKLGGVDSPFGDFSATGDPNALNPAYQAAYDSHANIINQGRESAISNVRQQMAANGITDPRALAAAEAHINAGHDDMLAQGHSNMMGQSYADKTGLLNQQAGQLEGLYGNQNQAQQQGYGNAFNFLRGGSNIYENAAQRAMQMFNNGQSSAASMFALAAANGGGGANLLPFPRQRPGGGDGGGGGGGTPASNDLPRTYGPSDYSYNPALNNSPANDYLNYDNPFGPGLDSDSGFGPMPNYNAGGTDDLSQLYGGSY